MGFPNSLCPDTVYLGIFLTSLSDVASSSTYPKREYQRDLQEVLKRVCQEGLSFLTKTLPSVARALDKALATGTPLQVCGLKKATGTQLPRFLGWLFKKVFDDFGIERSDASEDDRRETAAWAVSSLRQLLYTFSKLELPPSEKQVETVINSFKTTDANLDYDPDKLDHEGSFVRREAKAIIARVLSTVDPYSELLPRHGPGAVATREKGSQKITFKRFYPRLAAKFPYETYFHYNPSHLCDYLGRFLALREVEDGIARVVLVPKDSRGPRLISCEPLEYQWVQQGLMKILVKRIESHPLTGGQVNFSNQEINRVLAMRGSQGEPWVTLDMKEASDRVSLALVRDLVPERWFEALQASRTAFTQLPDGTVMPMKKFAPMGSAVCFPVEALIFWALCVATIRCTNPRLSLAKAAARCFVYGDDIIVQSQDQAHVRRTLPMFELLFNEAKCCTAGSFRESCGCDAYQGVDVTPLRVKCVWDPHLPGTDYESYTEYANAYYDRGMYLTGDFIAGLIQRVRKTPYSDVRCPAFVALHDIRKTARLENRLMGIRTRVQESKDPLKPSYQRYEIEAWQVRSRILEDTGQLGWDELLRVAAQNQWSTDSHSGSSQRENDYIFGVTTLESTAKWAKEITLPVTAYQYALPRQGTLRRGWCSFF
jgi:hypothetical protein